MVVAFTLMTAVAVAQQQLPVTLNARITVEVVPQVAKAGEPVKLKLAFKNVSCLPIQYLEVGGRDTDYEVAIFNADGSEVAYLPLKFPGDGLWHSKSSMVLWPSDESRETLEISRHFDLSREGKYSVRGSRRVSMAEPCVVVSHLMTFVIGEPEIQ